MTLFALLHEGCALLLAELLQRFFKKQSIAALKNRPSKSKKTGKTGQIVVRKTGKQDRTAYIMKKLLKRKMKFFIWTFDSGDHCTNHTNKFMKSSRMAQFYCFTSIIPSPWLKKILKFNILKSS